MLNELRELEYCLHGAYFFLRIIQDLVVKSPSSCMDSRKVTKGKEGVVTVIKNRDIMLV